MPISTANQKGKPKSGLEKWMKVTGITIALLVFTLLYTCLLYTSTRHLFSRADNVVQLETKGF